jgi:tetratricopeptide (TPR) repeat protein
MITTMFGRAATSAVAGAEPAPIASIAAIAVVARHETGRLMAGDSSGYDPPPMARRQPSPALRQARAALSRHDHRAAARLGEQMLAANPRDFDALMLLADVAGALGALAEEIAYVEKAAGLEPRNARLRAHLGHRYVVSGLYAKALAQFERALKLEPGLPAAVAGQASVHERRDRYAKALDVLKPALAGGAVTPEIAAVGTRVLLHEGRADEAAGLARRTIDAGHPPSARLRAVMFALARAEEMMEHYEEAFRIAREANAMLAVPFDADAVRRRTDDLVAVFTRERLAALPPPSEAGALAVFLVGMPRCGSTLAERVLHAHPEAHGADEIDALHRVISDLPPAADGRTFPHNVPGLDGPAIDRAATAYVEAIRPLAPKAARISNKHLANFMHVGLIRAILPGARVVHCRRDPLDTCLSCLMSPLAPGQAAYTQDLAMLAAYYRQYQRLMAHWREVLDDPPLEQDYERLVADQEATSRRLVAHCGLDWDDACLRFHEPKRADRTISFDQVRRPLYATSVGRAERFGAILDPLRAALREAGVKCWDAA